MRIFNLSLQEGATNHLRFKTIVCLGIALGLSAGCQSPKNEDVWGTYVRATSTETDAIVLKPDFTFHQTVKYRDGRLWEANGWWARTEYAIDLHEGLEVFDFEHNKQISPPQGGSNLVFLYEGDRLVSNESDASPYKKIMK